MTQRFFRRFGVLSGDSTPCGAPIPVTHAHALMVLCERGELSQQELGAELGVDKSNVARLCAKMVDAGHAKQRQSEHDGRSRRVELTVRGMRVAREVDRASKARFTALLAALPAQRRDRIIDALQDLVCALESMPEAGALQGVSA